MNRFSYERVAADIGVSAGLSITDMLKAGVVFGNTYHFECLDADGALKWEETVKNIVVNTGLNDILTQYWKGSSYSATHYVGLIGSNAAPVAGDTMASHAGWTEDTNYSNSNRPTITWGSVSSQSVDNSASKASFTMSGTTTIYGAFVTTNNTKGGTTGTLIGGALFASSRAVINGDTLNVTVTSTAASG